MIIALIIFFAFCVVMIIVKSHQPKQPKQSTTTNHTRKIINITIDASAPAKPREYYEQRRRHTAIRGARLDRHGRIWSVLFLVNTIHQLEECKNRGYVDRQLLSYLESAKKEVIERKPTRSDIKTAIKFCKIEHARGKCPHMLTPEDIKSITHIYKVACNPSAYVPK